MSLARTFQALRAQVIHSRPFDAARCRHGVLTEVGGVAELVVLLQDGATGATTRAAATRALLAEHRSLPEFWGAVLLLAFQPRLEALAAKHRRKKRQADLDEVVIASFLEAVAACPGLEDDAFTFLEREVGRRVRRALMKRREDLAGDDLLSVLSPEDVREVWTAPALCPKREQARFRSDLRAEAPELRALLRELVGDRLPSAMLELVCDTIIGGPGLLAYVRARFPRASPKQLQHEYHRLHRQRSAAVELLARILDPGELLGPGYRAPHLL